MAAAPAAVVPSDQGEVQGGVVTAVEAMEGSCRGLIQLEKKILPKILPRYHFDSETCLNYPFL